MIILNYLPELDNIQFSYHFNENSILQTINGISNDLKKFFKHFNGTAIFTPSFFLFAAPSASLLSVKLDLYLNDDELSTVKSTSPSISSF